MTMAPFEPDRDWGDESAYAEHRARLSDLCDICRENLVVEGDDFCRACLEEVLADEDELEGLA